MKVAAYTRRAPAKPKLICPKCGCWKRGRKALAKHAIKEHGK